MTSSQDILITDLLMEREDALGQVWRCEQLVTKILGRSYPFPSPPDLPSRRRKAKRPKVRSTPATIPRLKSDEETVYRVDVQEGATVRQSYQDNHRLLNKIIKISTPAFRIIRIQAGTYDDSNTFLPTRTVWEAKLS